MSTRPSLLRRSLGAFALALVFAPSAARACTACMGDPDEIGPAMNAAIFVMLGCIGSMLALVVGVAFNIARRSAKLDAGHTA